MFTRDDLVDGHRWQEPDGNSTVNLPTRNGGGKVQTSRGLTRSYDTYTNTTMGITFKLVSKKKTESTTLLNPIHYTYQKIAENDPEKAIQELLMDDDKDGVPNRLDQEENTPEGAPVSPKGIALDSDAIKSALKFCEMFMNEGKEVHLIEMDDKDPGELGFKRFTELIQKSVPLTLSGLLSRKLFI